MLEPVFPGQLRVSAGEPLRQDVQAYDQLGITRYPDVPLHVLTLGR